jgi:hypothetical protein
LFLSHYALAVNAARNAACDTANGPSDNAARNAA